LHLPFNQKYLWASFALTIIAGFGLASYLALIFGLGLSPGPNLLTLIQVHGHVQLMGWVGVLTIGISLFVFPRLVSRPLLTKFLSEFILCLLVLGLLLRSAIQIASGYFAEKSFALPFQIAVIIECAGLLAYMSVILKCSMKGDIPVDRRDEMIKFRPLLLCNLLGLFAYIVINLVLSMRVPEQGALILDAQLNSLQVEVFNLMFILPATILFGIKMLPMFLGLNAVKWNVALVAKLYLLSAIGSLIALFFQWTFAWYGGIAFLSLLTLAFTWKLDLFLRNGKPERVQLKAYRSDAEMSRGRYADRGEFGKFEYFIFFAFAYFTFWALANIGNLFTYTIFSISIINANLLRHIVLLGFVSNLIFGVGYRLIPGLISKKLWSLKLVFVSFLFLQFSLLGRILPLLFDLSPCGRHLYAFSGILSLLAITLFFVNMLFSCLKQSTV